MRISLAVRHRPSCFLERRFSEFRLPKRKFLRWTFDKANFLTKRCSSASSLCRSRTNSRSVFFKSRVWLLACSARRKERKILRNRIEREQSHRPPWVSFRINDPSTNKYLKFVVRSPADAIELEKVIRSRWEKQRRVSVSSRFDFECRRKTIVFISEEKSRWVIGSDSSASFKRK